MPPGWALGFYGIITDPHGGMFPHPQAPGLTPPPAPPGAGPSSREAPAALPVGGPRKCSCLAEGGRRTTDNKTSTGIYYLLFIYFIFLFITVFFFRSPLPKPTVAAGPWSHCLPGAEPSLGWRQTWLSPPNTPSLLRLCSLPLSIQP